MQFALLIYESPEAWSTRDKDKTNPYISAWRAYHKALVGAKIHMGGNPLEVPESGATVRIEQGTRRVQDGPYADTKEQLAGFILLELPTLDEALDWAARCPAAALGAVEVRAIAIEPMRKLTE
jgi:hypothetical protein